MHPGMTHYPWANTPVRVPDIVNAMRDPGFLPKAWGQQLGAGNALYDAYQSQNALQKLGVMPGIGDAAGFAGDLQSMYQNPEERTVLNALLAGAGLVPFVPAGLGTVKKTLPMDDDYSIDAFHATGNEFSEFSRDVESGASVSPINSLGHFFSGEKTGPSDYALRSYDSGRVIDAKLKLKKPLVIEGGNKPDEFVTSDELYFDENEPVNDLLRKIAKHWNIEFDDLAEMSPRQINIYADDYREWLIEEGYDGIVLKNSGDFPTAEGRVADQYIIFDSKNIKIK